MVRFRMATGRRGRAVALVPTCPWFLALALAAMVGAHRNAGPVQHEIDALGPAA